jgi:hypothetical protein
MGGGGKGCQGVGTCLSGREPVGGTAPTHPSHLGGVATMPVLFVHGHVVGEGCVTDCRAFTKDVLQAHLQATHARPHLLTGCDYHAEGTPPPPPPPNTLPTNSPSQNNNDLPTETKRTHAC